MRKEATLSATRPTRWIAGLALILLVGTSPGRATAAGWVLPDGQIGRNTAPLLLLSRPEVQADLKLTAETAAAIDREIADLYAKARALSGRRDPQAVAARRAVDEEQRTWIERNLSESQRERLAQLNFQWEGPSALHSRSVVADALNLSEDQKRKLASAVLDREKKRGVAGRDARADDVALGEGVFALLSDEQKSRWKAMLGPACTFRLATPAPTPTQAPVAAAASKP